MEWTTVDMCFDSRQGQETFLFCKMSRPTLRPNLLPIKWYRRGFSGAKKPQHEADHLSHLAITPHAFMVYTVTTLNIQLHMAKSSRSYFGSALCVSSWQLQSEFRMRLRNWLLPLRFSECPTYKSRLNGPQILAILKTKFTQTLISVRSIFHDRCQFLSILRNFMENSHNSHSSFM
jgi:hypothetical protein